MKKITYVTGNWAKIASAKQYLEPLGIEIDNIKMETPEIQADDVAEVAKYSAKWAANELGIPVIKNDTGFFIDYYKGFPGAYMKYMDETLGVDGFLKLMDGVEDRSAYLKEAIAYCEPGGEPIVFEGITKGSISYESSGEYGWGTIDHLFIPEGEKVTLGNFPDKERWNFWSVDAYIELGRKRRTISPDMVIVAREYGISLQLLAKRANQLEIITTDAYRSFNIAINKARVKISEGYRIEPEEPKLLEQLVLRALDEDKISMSRAAELLDIPYHIIREKAALWN